jgi:hypothetical protein
MAEFTHHPADELGLAEFRMELGAEASWPHGW